MSALALLGLLSIALTIAVTTSAYMLPAAAADGGQSRRESIVEAWMNVAVGFTINYAANFAILPLVGLQIGLGDNFWMGCIYTAVSVARSYAIRRWFNAKMKGAARHIAGVSA